MELNNYKIIYPTGWSDNFILGVNIFKKEVERLAKFKLSIQNDCSTAKHSLFLNNCKEILLGKLNRKESQDCMIELSNIADDECLLKCLNNKIIILGKTDDVTFKGMKYFLNSILLGNKSKLEDFLKNNESSKIKVNLKSNFIYQYFVEFEIEEQTIVYYGNEQYPKEQCTYGRIIKIENSENGLNNLYCTRESECGSGDNYPIYESVDNGATWKHICSVYDTINDGFKAGWQPFLFELTKDMGAFKKGTVILAGCSRKFVEKQASTFITLYYSVDCCKTWTQFVNVDTASGQGRALWEPFLTFDEKTKRIYCFYSDDTQPKHNQKLCYKYSYDLVNWIGNDSLPNRTDSFSYPFDCVACDDENARPGMVVITKMGNGEYFLVMEAADYGTWCQIYYKTANSLDGWAVNDGAKPIMTADGKSLGSSPFVVWTPNGGECGTLIVIGKHLATGSKRSEADLIVSFDYGKTFVAVENPVFYKHWPNNRCGYSCSFYVDKDGTVYYIADRHSEKYAEDLVFTRLKIK